MLFLEAAGAVLERWRAAKSRCERIFGYRWLYIRSRGKLESIYLRERALRAGFAY